MKSESLSKTDEFYLLVTNLEVLTFVQTLIYFFLLFCLLKCAKLSSIICYKTRNSVIFIVRLQMTFQGFILRKLGEICFEYLYENETNILMPFWSTWFLGCCPECIEWTLPPCNVWRNSLFLSGSVCKVCRTGVGQSSCSSALPSVYLPFVSKARQHVAHFFTRGDGDDVTVLSPCFIEWTPGQFCKAWEMQVVILPWRERPLWKECAFGQNCSLLASNLPFKKSLSLLWNWVGCWRK